MANFIQADNKGLIITTNKVTSISNLNTIENYIKNIDVVDSNNVISLRLLQFKSYLKILDISYLIKNMNVLITANIVKKVLQSTYIFNNIILASRPHIIKVSLKFNIAVIWIDIWDTQSSSKAKGLINRYFNIESHIATIWGKNMNPGILQCKNCQK